ncbi:Haloacid dehalogenase-like hydrolase domain-containing protein 3 [Polyrhizophydium stewartii]|uniref:Haloacid dehalogenase-like hydrolase domain-containing protein 3 n=1 Tax=Polyrhizophydium stewartii TaxID=2732419 RepID=A0ABR4MZS4_9FUNG|nr:Haloacid dehalogenase-like hydrolase domain-containing protein 3 [Polyrhizophydium stewartii]
MPPLIRLVALDAYGTLFRVRQSPGITYAAAARELLQREGTSDAQPASATGRPQPELLAALADRDRASRAFAVAYRRQAAAHPNFGHGSMAPREWWAEVVRATLLQAGCSDRDVDAVFAPLFESVYDRFATADMFDVYADTRRTLDALARRATLAVITNSDARTDAVLAALDLRRHLHHVVCSNDIGVLKPHAAIFTDSLRRAGMHESDAAQALYVGDDVHNDYQGAINAGWNARLLIRRDPADTAPLVVPDGVDPRHVITSLDELVPLLE